VYRTRAFQKVILFAQKALYQIVLFTFYCWIIHRLVCNITPPCIPQRFYLFSFWLQSSLVVL
jgi:uncharacterized membrane protein